MADVYKRVAFLVGDRLGLETTFSTGRSFAEFESGVADVGFVCGLPYVELTRLHPVPVELLTAPVLVGDRYRDLPIYFSDVIVSQQSQAESFDDLRGSSWSYNEPHSHSGYNVVCHRLVALGAGSDFFGRIVAAGWHQRSIDMVADGVVDASAIDSQVLAIEFRDRPDLHSRIKVIDTLGPSTIQPVVAASRLDAGLKNDIRGALLEMAADRDAREILDRGLIKRWQPIGDAAYDDIRTMLSAVEASGVSLRRSPAPSR